MQKNAQISQLCLSFNDTYDHSTTSNWFFFCIDNEIPIIFPLISGVVECLKIITASKSERIAKFAFDYAVKMGRKKVTAVHKANIMKLGDGLFLRSCEEVIFY